ncbi:carbohydrate ABC transporter permease [Candidatus Aerophobetes bacterium]|nr:carbohydrate ABC transporter permease [Candidatus Aerophobetes bacterium]
MSLRVESYSLGEKNLKIRRNKGKKKKAYLKKALVYLFLVLIAIAMMAPLLWMFSSAFKFKAEIFTYPPTLISKNPTISNFFRLFEQVPFGRNLWNSFFIAASSTALSLFFCSLAAFSFAKYQFPARDYLFLFLIGTLIIPFHTTMIPLYVLYRKIGWINKPWGLIFPGMANAYGIFFMRQYLIKIPNDFLDSARIDGCSEFKIFLYIILPIARPALTGLGIIFFMGSWNNFLWPLVILRSREAYTALVALTHLVSGLRTPYGLIMAGSTLLVLPLIVFFVAMQKQFIAGITAGAIKG